MSQRARAVAKPQGVYIVIQMDQTMQPGHSDRSPGRELVCSLNKFAQGWLG